MTCYSFLTILSKYLSRPRADNYDPEAILIGSIQKEKSMEHSGKQNTSDPRRRPSADRYRHRSSFSDRYNHPHRRFPKMFQIPKHTYEHKCNDFDFVLQACAKWRTFLLRT